MSICEKCGSVMEGMAFVDYVGEHEGELRGGVEAFCIPCYVASFPYPAQEELRKLRISRGLSHRQAGLALGLTPGEVSGIESGRDPADPAILARMRELYAKTGKR